jgi:hypothetical protein
MVFVSPSKKNRSKYQFYSLLQIDIPVVNKRLSRLLNNYLDRFMEDRKKPARPQEGGDRRREHHDAARPQAHHLQEGTRNRRAGEGI